MLQVGLAALEQGPLTVAGTMPADDALFEGLDFVLEKPVDVTGQLTAAGPGSYYWHGEIRTTAGRICRRCLAAVLLPVSARVNILFTEDQQTDDPSVYPIPVRARTIDLSDAVREELILAVPEYVLCREDCRGLCPRCGKDLNDGPCGCPPGAADPRWAALGALKQKTDHEQER